MKERERSPRPDARTGEEFFTFLAEAIPQIVWTARRDGSVEYYNRRWYQYTGLTPGESLERGWQTALHPDDLGSAAARWEAALAAGEPLELEGRFRSAEGTYRWHLVRAVPLPHNGPAWVGTITEIQAQKTAERALEFLAEASRLLSSSLGSQETLAHLTWLAVPRLADWCAVFVRNPDGTVRSLAAAHGDREQVAFARELERRFPYDPEATAGVPHVIRTGNSEFYPRITDEALRANTRTDEHLELAKTIGMHSAMIVPLVSRGATFGALALVSAESRRTFTEADLQFAEELGRRAGVAVENARLYEEERRAAEKLRFLAEASRALSSSLDFQATADGIVRVALPTLGEWCAVHLLEESGDVLTIAMDHVDSAAAALVAQLRGKRFINPGASDGTPRVLRTGTAEIVRTLDEILSTARLVLPEREAMSRLGFTSGMIVPLTARGRTFGTIAFATTQSGRVYGEDDLLLADELGRRAAMALDNARLYEREHRVADTLQRAMLPAKLPHVPGFQFHSAYLPGDSESEVGGDWFDAFRLVDGRIAVSVGDVAGHGLEAAVIMGEVRQALRAAAMESHLPALVLERANTLLRMHESGAIVTAVFGLIDPVTREFTYATAGHPPPILATREGSVEVLQHAGLPLGLRGAESGTSYAVQLAPGSLLVLYTDGLVEFGKDVVAGELGLLEAIRAEVRATSPNPAASIQRRALGGHRHADDIAILTVQLAASDDPWIAEWTYDSGEAPTAYNVRRQFLRFVERCAAPGSPLDGALTAFGELVANAAEHAPGPITILVDWSKERPTLMVSDYGGGFQPQPSLPEDPLGERGRGLFIISQVADDLQVTRRPGGGTSVSVTLRLQRADKGPSPG